MVDQGDDMKNFSVLVLVASALLMTGCAQKINITPGLQYVTDPERIKNEYSGANVALVNNNHEDVTKYFSDWSIHTVEGNMHKWTQQAIEVAAKEIQQRGGVVAAAESKKILMSFEGEGLVSTHGGYTLTCKGTLKVETNLGYKQQYPVTSSTPGTPDRACGGAITVGVIAFLNDKNIVDFMAPK